MKRQFIRVKKQSVLIIAALAMSTAARAQLNIGSNNAPDPNAMLEVSGSTKGLLLPRVTLVATNSASPLAAFVTGMHVYNTATAGSGTTAVSPGEYYSDGTQWFKVTASASGNDRNLYNGDGTLAGNRTVTMAGSNLTFGSTTGNLVFNSSATGKVGIGTIAPQTTFHIDGAKDNPATGAPDTTAQKNDFVVTQGGNVGIGTTSPAAKLEITSGTNGVSGLKFNNINSGTGAVVNRKTASLGVDSTGSVVIQNSAPVQTIFRSFSIDTGVAANSLVTVGTLEFRYAGNCLNATSYMQVRSTSGANNAGIIHGIYVTAQNTAALENSIFLSITPTFANITAAPLNCVEDGHAQFSFFSYTDRTYYRVNVHIADGDGLGFGALGYIYVEYQR